MGNIIYARPLDISSCGLQIKYKRYLKKDFFVMCHMQYVNNDDGFKVILMRN